MVPFLQVDIPVTRESLRAGAISDASLSETLMVCRGDIFLTSQYLGCTAREIDGYIRASDDLRAFVQAIATVKHSDEYDKLSSEQFDSELKRLVLRNRFEAEGIIADMARMAMPEGASMAEVKLKAAVAMRGTPDKGTQADVGQSLALQELNKLYVESAPRIRSVRAVQIEFEG